MTRIIAGVAGGRRLTVPPGRDTRPTSDRAREGLFGTVRALLGPLDGLRVADLFAGSGAVGLEALSRGAAHALLVEAHPRAVTVIRRNVAALGLPGAEVVAGRVERLVRRRPELPYDLVFLDPPYALADEAVSGLLEALRDNGWLAADALVAVERAARGPALRWPPGYLPERDRRYGEAVFWYGRAAGSTSG
ncbi:16S rRNA (guanine(966)-N(2))-methyltransferase RsmD [Thermomonospora catenispora]|uniref:16S rRNA (guanine(966)-N(2))-methyltransferase RsmD n=1 Tax=Thermomonospora catenispora TaxID=2493090 RepID=UPI00112122FD|nr:16S rRNA (guanine(966)-N(2))-methyltransferase RsmD [Thermomonospora catenispora]TNY36092.1 16S rRNA (guanine(966)-N(2))-methyltransferase RsmD [Thermomonospora catenispora]